MFYSRASAFAVVETNGKERDHDHTVEERPLKSGSTVVVYIYNTACTYLLPFNALTLLAGHQEGYPAYRNLMSTRDLQRFSFR